MEKIIARPLTAKEYLPYGNVIEAAASDKTSEANQGTARRFNWLSDMENQRPSSARLNVCVFRCVPREIPFTVRLLERHAYSTQAFIPMTCKTKYLVIVAKNNLATDTPDLTTLRAFVARPNQGVTYYAGTWHHPMIALDSVTEFTCLVHEDGTWKDCEVLPVNPNLLVELPAHSSL